ncbi:retrovirus-related pol polyprotein from transposon TNT 1-94 [Tanacetum coccineum]
MVTVQQVQGRQSQRFAGTGTKGNAISSGGNNDKGQARVVKCYNYQAERHMARHKNLVSKAMLMANLSSYDSDVLSEMSEQMSNHVTIWDKVNQETKTVNESLTTELERNKERVKAFEQRFNIDSSSPLGYQNPFYLKKAQRIKPTLYDGIVIFKKHDMISMIDEEETLILEYESRSKMLAKQNDPISKEKNINISPINYSELNKLSEDFEKCFVPQKQLFEEQAFWLPISNHKSEPLVVTQTPIEIEVPKELPKVSLVNTSFQKLKNHLARFDKVVKVRTTPDAITEGSWGFEHTKKVFLEEVIPFINSLRASFKDFNNGLHCKFNEVKMIFNQMEAAVEQCYNADVVYAHVSYVNNNKFIVHDNLEIERLEQENDHLFELLLSQDTVHICVNSIATCNNCHEMQHSFIHEYNENLMLKAELANKKENMVEKKFFNEDVLRCSRLENRSANLELKLHQKKSFLNNIPLNNQNASEIQEFFHINEWQAKLDAKDVSIAKLKKHIENLKGKDVVENDATPNNAKEVLVYVTTTCPSLTKHREKLVAVTPECMFDAIHDLCILDFVNDVNVRSKSKSAKSIEKKNIWKPTGKVFTDIRYRWKPTVYLGKFLRSKDEVPEFVIKFLKMIQVHLNATVRNIRTDNGIEFANQTLRAYYEDAEAVATTCYTQNRSLIRKRHNKTPYELLHNKKADLSYLHVFGALCYLTNDSEDLGKLKPKADIIIFVDSAPAKKAYQIYNKRTRLIIKTIHVDFDDLTAMASEQFSLGHGPQLLTPGTISSGLHFNPPPSVASPVLALVALEPADLTGTPFSTPIDQDAPSLNNDPFFGVPIPKPNTKESSSRVVIPANVHSVNQPP